MVHKENTASGMHCGGSRTGAASARPGRGRVRGCGGGRRPPTIGAAVPRLKRWPNPV